MQLFLISSLGVSAYIQGVDLFIEGKLTELRIYSDASLARNYIPECLKWLRT